jgi:hypothetical protein
MKNQNTADISAFESLQADQHAKTGVSSIGVFNSPADVKNVIQHYVKTRVQQEDAIDTLADAYDDLERLLDKEAKRINSIDDAIIRKNEAKEIENLLNRLPASPIDPQDQINYLAQFTKALNS